MIRNQFQACYSASFQKRRRSRLSVSFFGRQHFSRFFSRSLSRIILTDKCWSLEHICWNANPAQTTVCQTSSGFRPFLLGPLTNNALAPPGFLTEKPPENTTKHPVDWPRGSKNKPDAGMKGNLVGRPQKSQPALTARTRAGQAVSRTGTQGECLGSVVCGSADHRLRGSRTLVHGIAGSQPNESGRHRWYVLDFSNDSLLSTDERIWAVPVVASGCCRESESAPATSSANIE